MVLINISFNIILYSSYKNKFIIIYIQIKKLKLLWFDFRILSICKYVDIGLGSENEPKCIKCV